MAILVISSCVPGDVSNEKQQQTTTATNFTDILFTSEQTALAEYALSSGKLTKENDLFVNGKHLMMDSSDSTANVMIGMDMDATPTTNSATRSLSYYDEIPLAVHPELAKARAYLQASPPILTSFTYDSIDDDFIVFTIDDYRIYDSVTEDNRKTLDYDTVMVLYDYSDTETGHLFPVRTGYKKSGIGTRYIDNGTVKFLFKDSFTFKVFIGHITTNPEKIRIYGSYDQDENFVLPLFASDITYQSGENRFVQFPSKSITRSMYGSQKTASVPSVSKIRPKSDFGVTAKTGNRSTLGEEYQSTYYMEKQIPLVTSITKPYNAEAGTEYTVTWEAIAFSTTPDTIKAPPMGAGLSVESPLADYTSDTNYDAGDREQIVVFSEGLPESYAPQASELYTVLINNVTYKAYTFTYTATMFVPSLPVADGSTLYLRFYTRKGIGIHYDGSTFTVTPEPWKGVVISKDEFESNQLDAYKIKTAYKENSDHYLNLPLPMNDQSDTTSDPYLNHPWDISQLPGGGWSHNDTILTSGFYDYWALDFGKASNNYWYKLGADLVFSDMIGLWNVDELDIPVIATSDGKIVFSNFSTPNDVHDSVYAYGNLIILEHYNRNTQIFNGYRTLYAHLQQDGAPSVNIGNDISSGNFLGFIGNTGKSGADHLHWGIYYNQYSYYYIDSSGTRKLCKQWDNRMPYYSNGYWYFGGDLNQKENPGEAGLKLLTYNPTGEYSSEPVKKSLYDLMKSGYKKFYGTMEGFE